MANTLKLARAVSERVPAIAMRGVDTMRRPKTCRNRYLPSFQPKIVSQRRFLSGVSTDQSTDDNGKNNIPSSLKVEELCAKITQLSEDEVNILGALVIQVLGRKIFPGEFGRGLTGVVVNTGELHADATAEMEVKTKFSVKLVGFDSQAKIKVIKEVRAIAGLGLKEAKDLVESVPKLIAKDLSSDKAEELKAQLEAVGAHILID